jgi:hypothetical protein
MHISSNSSRPLPVTDSASENDRQTLRRNALQPPAALVERQSAQARTVEPEDIESHVTGAPRHAEQLVELGSATLVGRDYLAIDDGFVDIKQPANLVGERLETAQDIAVARDEAATAMLKIAEAPEPIVFELKEPFRVVERLLSPGRDDRLYTGKCHPADMARQADFVQCPLAPSSCTGMLAAEAELARR